MVYSSEGNRLFEPTYAILFEPAGHDRGLFGPHLQLPTAQ